jgi:hypothetical protein
MCTIIPALDVKLRVDPGIHSLMEPSIWACYMRLVQDSRYWFMFLLSLAFRSSADLEIAYWVSQRDPNGRVSFGSNSAHVVHYTSAGRPASFTVYRENFMNLPRTNGLLGRFRNVNDADLEVGNVLMIKHPLRDVRHIENMAATDLGCAAKLMRWCVKPGKLCRWLFTGFIQGRSIRSSVGFKLPASALPI